MRLLLVTCLVPPACAGAPSPPAPAPHTAAPPAPRAAAPVPAPAVATGPATPCFPDAPSLVATDVYRRLEKHSWAWSQAPSEQPAPEAFGTCTVRGGQIKAADGTLVAELGCGVMIKVRGIRDDLGLEIGARGADVVRRWTVPHGPMTCWANGPDQVRCRYGRAPDDGDTDFTSYLVVGSIAGDLLQGATAERWFADREIVEIWHSVWCH